jgi:hypothetical protein
MRPASETVHQVARDFARRIADRPEAVDLHVSIDEDEDAIVLWLETASIETDTEVELHKLTAEVNDRYPDEYILLRMLNPARSRNPRGILPGYAEHVQVQGLATEIDEPEDTRPH